LKLILSELPADFTVPIIVVQHLPNRYFTESLAEHLDSVSDLNVHVLGNNEKISRGGVHLVPSGFYVSFSSRSKNEVTGHLTRAEDPLDLSPSVDSTMKSAAKIFKENTIGIVLTGMGKDGLEGMRAIKKAGGKTFAQDESSLIFGMPKEVIDAGLADKVLPADMIANALTAL